MSQDRKIEIFSAGCPVCEEVIQVVMRLACPSCDINILDMREPEVASRAKSLRIKSVPAIVIDGRIAECCVARGPDESTLQEAGLGQPE